MQVISLRRPISYCPRSPLGLSVISGCEEIAHTAHRLDLPTIAYRGIKLLAKPADVHVQTAIERIERPLENPFHKLFAIKHKSGGLHEPLEQQKFNIGQVERLLFIGDCACVHVRLEWSQAEWRRWLYRSCRPLPEACTAMDRPHTRQQLTRIEWLRKVIIRPGLQPIDPILVLTTRGQQHDTHVRNRA